MSVLRSTIAVAVVATLCLFAAARITASEQLTRAKELYRSASYDDALKVLDGLPADSDETIEVQQYRVLCLIALDRRDDARVAMAGLVSASPFYRLPEEDTSPRVLAMFADVRKSVLPGIAQSAYADAKMAFDRKEPDAHIRFDRVLELLKDPVVASDPALADLATVATGFRDLSRASAPAPTPAQASGTAPASGAAARPTATAAATPGLIVQPIAISQPLPALPPQMRDAGEFDGEVELVIDRAGKVVSARMTKPIHPWYDAQLLRTARSWTYRPATRDGVPTQIVKLVGVHLDTRPECGRRVTVDCRPVAQ